MYARSLRWIRVVLFLPVALQLFAGADERARFFKPGALKVLILSGRNNHEWRVSTPYLEKLLVDTGRFDVRVCEEPTGITQETLAPYDVIVVDYGGPRWGEVTEKAVESFVGAGKGMVAVHGASYMFSGLEVLADGHAATGIKEPPWLEYGRMVGGSWSAVPPKQFHGQRHSFQVKIVQKDHPVVQGMPAAFTATDELYHQMNFLPSTRILAVAFDDSKYGGTGQDEPMLCANQYGRGRVFYTALGHDLAAMRESGFISTFVRGAEWAASGKVTLPPDAAAVGRRSPPIRALVVTGGHEYETSFYTLFEGYDDLAWTHAGTNTEAFKSDIRDSCDVLVLYDMSANLDEKGRANLRNFLESGKGTVVLHHAIADYQDWPWWYREVVGGRYLLQPDAGMPASTYKHDEEIFVTPVMNHPITAGIGPMHLWDETYKGMWISPDVKVLLRSDNPTSDPSVAWISPYSKSRVVYIQLGHDHAAHRHPAYRALVHNAILWAAGRPGGAGR
jgi:type 1 glutamine amidotransferase